jgi:hypothetical protein
MKSFMYFIIYDNLSSNIDIKTLGIDSIIQDYAKIVNDNDEKNFQNIIDSYSYNISNIPDKNIYQYPKEEVFNFIYEDMSKYDKYPPLPHYQQRMNDIDEENKIYQDDEKQNSNEPKNARSILPLPQNQTNDKRVSSQYQLTSAYTKRDIKDLERNPIELPKENINPYVKNIFNNKVLENMDIILILKLLHEIFQGIPRNHTYLDTYKNLKMSKDMMINKYYNKNNIKVLDNVFDKLYYDTPNRKYRI